MSPSIKKKAIYPGSFDPMTNGHLDILDRALKVFDEVTIVVAGGGGEAPGNPELNPKKNVFFTPDERVELIREVVADRPGVRVDRWSGLIMDYARANNVSAVVRGLRAASDFEYEFMMASMNRELNPEVDTLFMMTANHLYFVSSSMVKELFVYGGDISPYVPEAVAKRLKERGKK